MRQGLNAFLQDQLNAGLDPESAEPEHLRRVRNLTMATAGFALMALPIIVTNTMAFGARFGVVLALAVAIVIANVAWLRRTQRIDAAGHVATATLFSYLAFALWHGGGVDEPAFASVYLVPLTAAFLVGAAGAGTWSGACVLLALGFRVAGGQGWIPESLLTGDVRDDYLLLGHVVAIFGIGILAGSFARNHERLQERLRSVNSELASEADYIRVMHRAAVLANDAGSAEEALSGAVELVCSGLGWEVGTVWVPRAGEERFESLAGHVRDGEGNAEFRRVISAEPLGPEESLVGLARSGRAPVFSPDVSRDVRFAHREAARAAGLHGALAFPLVLGKEVVAVVEFYRREARGPERRLLRLLAHIGTQVNRVLERQRAEARIENLAYYDSLTGLPNRRFFQGRLAEALADAERAGLPAALLFLDLDGFKRVNDTLGHAVGDGLLREVTRRFAHCVRPSDMIGRGDGGDPAVSRLGGDEFTVLLGRVPDRPSAATVAERLLEALEAPIEIDGNEIFAGASIGIAMYPEDGRDPDTLLRHADAAMYAAKQRGRGQFQFFADEESQDGSRRLQIEGPLRRALQNDRFELHYQPLLDMQTRETIGAEALLRWYEPGIGHVSPGEFIPLAEQCGLINPIGEWIIRAACIQLRSWIEDGYAPVRVAVNLSGQQIRGPALVRSVAAALEESEIAPEWIELEITESTIMRDDDVTSSTLRALSDLGLRLVLDDFGTGYSSLSHLRRHPIEALKLDRSFVSGVPDDAEDKAIAAAVIAMAHGLGKRVTAEGIETEEQLAFLREAGCDVAQGFLFSKAVPGNDFVRYLARAEKETTGS